MAQQAVKRAAPAAQTGGNIGRPAGSRNVGNSKKPAGPAVFDYALSDQTFQKPQEFYRYLEGYPNKQGLLAYIYRLKPKIDLSLIGIEETTILRTAVESEMTEEHVAEQFGRGLYMLTLNDANRPKGQKEVAKTWFDCSMAPKPPQYDPRTLCLAEPKNQDEITRLLNTGVFVNDKVTGRPRVRTTDDGPQPVTPVAAPANGTGEIFGRDMVAQIVLAALNRGTQSPHDTVKDTIEIARLLVPASQPGPDLETIVERVVTRLNGAEAPSDPFRTYERMENFLDKMRPPVTGQVLTSTGSAIASAVGGESAATWAPHLPGIFREARGFITELFQELRIMREMSPANGAPAANGHQPQAPVARRPATMNERIEEVCRMGFERMSEGMKGFDFAAWVCMFHPGGLEVFQYLAQSGAMGVIALLAFNPASRALANDPVIRPQLETFLTDFFSFDPNPSEDESGESVAASA